MKKRYIYSSLLAAVSFIILYVVLEFHLLICLPIVAVIYFAGILLYKEKDVRTYNPNDIMHYCYLISKIDNFSNLIKDKNVKANIKDISTKSERIVVMLEQKPNKVTQVYESFDFYLPQTIKILEQYVYTTGREKKTKEEEKFIVEINETLDYIENEVDKLLNNMNYTKMLDINASIEMFKKSNKRVQSKIEERSEDDA